MKRLIGVLIFLLAAPAYAQLECASVDGVGCAGGAGSTNVAADYDWTGLHTFPVDKLSWGGAIQALNSCWLTTGGFTCEGATANDFETRIVVTDPFADTTFTIGPSPDGNPWIGATAGDSAAATEVDNVFIGSAAGTAASSTSTDNTCVGDNACLAVTTGDQNTAVGSGAGGTTTTGSYNTQFGYSALTKEVGTAGGTAIGNTTIVGDNAVAVGYGAEAYAGSVSIGTGAGDAAAAVDVNNVFIGDQAGGAASGTSTDNTCVGDIACTGMTTGDRNICLGQNSCAGLTTGGSNLFIGVDSTAITTSAQNVVIGDGNIAYGNTGVAIGYGADVSDGVAIGYQAGDAVAAVDVDNVFIGNSAGTAANGTSTDNTCVGDTACDSLTTGDQVVVIGADADLVGAGDSAVIVIGAEAKGGNSGGVTIGTSAGSALVAGADYNTLVGHRAGAAMNNTGADNNTCFGYQACASVTSGDSITAVGSGAASTTITTGTDDVFIGRQSGLGTATTTSNTVIIGAGAGANIDGSTNTCVGSGACDDVTANNSCLGFNCFGADATNTFDNNTGVGTESGEIFADDSDSNICVGYQACGVGTSASVTYDNTTTIGSMDPKGSNSILLGFGTQEHYFHQGTAKALTESTDTPIVRISVAQGAAGMVGAVIEWTVVASDGTDHQTLTGITQLNAINKAGTETCTAETLGGTAEASSSGTLAMEDAPDCVSSVADTVDFQLDMVSSLTQTTLNAYYTIRVMGPATTITPQ